MISLNWLRKFSSIGFNTTPEGISMNPSFTPDLIPYLLRKRFGISNWPLDVKTGSFHTFKFEAYKYEKYYEIEKCYFKKYLEIF